MSDECEPELSEFIALLGAHPECRGEIRNILTQEEKRMSKVNPKPLKPKYRKVFNTEDVGCEALVHYAWTDSRVHERLHKRIDRLLGLILATDAVVIALAIMLIILTKQ